MEATITELQYSSSLTKLLRRRLIAPLYPVTLQLVPTDTCNLNCDFCSVKNRPGNELDLDIIEKVLYSEPFVTHLKAVEITGGGEPTMYPKINELIELCWRAHLQMGIITNGTVLKRKVKHLERLTWIRVSLNCLDYVPDIDLSGIPDHVTLGCSYVLNDRTTQDILDKVGDYADKYNAAYVRIVPDCLDLDKGYDFDVSHPKFYIQTKTYQSLTPVAPCRMGFLKPYLNSDGYFYWCSGVCLEERRFPEEYRMGAWNEAADIWATGWKQEQKPFECHFSKCFWVEHNKLLELANTPVLHGAFL